jgi:hypothetical protein
VTSVNDPDPMAFRRSLADRIKRTADVTGRTTQQLQRQFLLQRFLARVFAEPAGPWVLKGGTGLLMRLQEARHSRDIDLVNTDSALAEATTELREAVQGGVGDPLMFVLGQPTMMSGGVAGSRIPVEVLLGGIRFEHFTVDLATDLRTFGVLERTRPEHIIDMPTLPRLPEFVLYPLPDQVCDKVCAMYQRRGDSGRVSSRYRDLVDLVLITGHLCLDAAATVAAVREQSRQRHIDLPSRLVPPGPEWPRGYRAIARDSRLDPSVHDLSAALAYAGSCLNPLLDGRVTSGTWQPAQRVWDA